ncbi:hypothetical protein M2475_001418 [Breznakia sp. PF5-3]|uniref:DUF4438 domain-containing protein n=1 Tax=unclassified Breznakia TaxID=2623764 RepID=UPI002405F694|nr:MULTISPECIES: DUF4438 domain-containing protein [unclassified Breznakia]MDF9824963.1 hypothetical protein [Breznakia sp. PM6-1]MDF9835844.1 hypothetical protein [Breznakia sp. PF5-3]MDF9836904.1 hypothetical protein [Breznakia sp. PFB2-8]MDF9859850.1 hypothetical protein [Breznakia sp. PH5-24]
MKTNKDKLVMHSLTGKIHHPTNKGYRVGFDGVGRILPATGGITYNFQIGDNCMGIVGDHVEPGVSIQNPNHDENPALQLFSCVGNTVRITSGDAKGKMGVITGTHGGIEHAFVYFDEDTLDLLNGDESMLIKGFGQGLELLDYPNIKVLNLDPKLLSKMHLHETKGVLEIGVTHIIPAFLMGSGLGANTLANGDYDIMTQDKEMNKKYHLDTLRFGDIVAIQDHNSINGPHFSEGAWTIGIIVHSDSYTSGHGPGVCALFTSKDGSLKPFIEKDANLKNYL